MKKLQLHDTLSRKRLEIVPDDGSKFRFYCCGPTVYGPAHIGNFRAFLVQDFTGYWMHRLNHRVNIFWNRHIIHHSSEEFNLSCALRQSISETFRFSAILVIPAALLGIPTKIFAILGPIHLFMQFWYHTRLIDKMGFLEKIIVTPSHHRVHHAINPEYLDKNYGQILIIWDKLFNTFQEEIREISPVYGTLRPVSTWNPILINFKHMFQLCRDAWYAENPGIEPDYDELFSYIRGEN